MPDCSTPGYIGASPSRLLGRFSDVPNDPNVATGVAAIVARPNPYPNAMNAPQFLVIQRAGAPPAEGAGTWSVPGGWMDDGESPHETAMRETREEVGIETSHIGTNTMGVVTHRSATTGLWCVTIFVPLYGLSAEVACCEPDKISAVRWVTKREFHLEIHPRFTPLQLAVDQFVI